MKRRTHVSQAFKLEGIEDKGASEACSSPICRETFEQTGIVRMEPTPYCSPKCRWNAWIIRKTAELLKAFTDEQKAEILKDALR